MTRVDQTLLARAADFRVLLDSGRATQADRQACDAWRRQSDAHELAWVALDRRLASCTADLRMLAGQMSGHGKAVKDVLTLPNRSRRVALLALVGAAGALATAGVVDRWIPLATLAAAYSTRTGERRTWRLADGSALTLDARSSADVDVGAKDRSLLLREGQAIMQVAAGSPFVAQSWHCRAELPAQAAGTFMVRLAQRRTLLVAMRGNLDVVPAGGKRFVLAEGSGCWLDESSVTLLGAMEAAAETAWQGGRIQILDQPLAVLIDALRNYRPGYIRVSDSAARLRVQGVFSLDDTESTLHALAETMPVQVRRYGPWLVDIKLRPVTRGQA
jgi:transmembrane sensor